MPEKTDNGYAIVDIGGKQFRVTAGQELKVPHTHGESGTNLKLDRVLAFNDGGTTQFGNPTVTGATVDATILDHGRGRKITVFKFRRRKGYRVKAGHRQEYSILRINDIKVAAPKAAPKATEKKPAGAKAPAKTKAKTAPRKTAAAKTTAKKPAAGKQTAKGAAATGAKPAPKKSTPVKKKAATKTATKVTKSAATAKSASTGKSPRGKKSTASQTSAKKKTD
ncbi:MAG: 50S ribosomal protein L21 [Fidelibacterota bacterium]|nr:MAG: 50S ribosomal protein L21 [Candidatus Neomarinimicrobiota bacterium]